MKVFISHSSRDKWIARKISQEIEELGVSTFLDEKNIETGDSIDGAIGAHLKDSDELLMLLSPTSITSPWVLIEIGGAKALGKRLVPILLHVPPNDVPSPLRDYLARDLNDVDKYYDELRARLKGGTPKPSKPRRAARAPVLPMSFKKGERIRIARKPSEVGLFPGWNDEMNAFTGHLATVIGPGDTGPRGERTLKIDVDGGRWHWLTDWLDHADKGV